MTTKTKDNIIEPCVSAFAKCGCCGHQWKAVRPLKVEFVNVECPSCGSLTGLDIGPHWPVSEGENETVDD